MWDLDPSITWFYGPTRVSPLQNGISIDSAVFAQLARVSDRHADHATCRHLYSNRLHPSTHCVQAMRPNKRSENGGLTDNGKTTGIIGIVTSQSTCSAGTSDVSRRRRTRRHAYGQTDGRTKGGRDRLQVTGSGLVANSILTTSDSRTRSKTRSPASRRRRSYYRRKLANKTACGGRAC